MKVLRWVFREVGGQQPMYSRPISVQDVSHNDVLALASATNGGKLLTSANISGVGSRIVAPRAQAGRELQIDNGWRERRWFWVAHIEMMTGRQQTKVKVLSGYTDSHDVITRSGHIDPHMRLWINNQMEINQSLIMTGRGQEWNITTRGVDQVLNSMSLIGSTQAAYTHALARPQDLFQRKALGDHYDIAKAEGDEIYDLRLGFTEGALKFSNRRNTIPSHYLERTMKAWAASTDESPYIGTFEDNEVAQMASGKVQEAMLLDDKIFQEIANDSEILESRYMQWYELLRMPGNQNLNNIVEVYFDKPGLQSFGMGERSESWRSAATETVIAVQASQAIMVIMMELMYADIHVFITNDTIGGQADVKVAKLSPFTDEIDINTYFNVLINRIEIEVLREVSLNGQRVVSLEINASVWGETVVTVSLENGAPIMHTNPSFADSIGSSMVCDNFDELDRLSDRLTDLVSEIRQVSPVNRQSAGAQMPNSPVFTPSNSFI